MHIGNLRRKTCVLVNINRERLNIGIENKKFMWFYQYCKRLKVDNSVAGYLIMTKLLRTISPNISYQFVKLVISMQTLRLYFVEPVLQKAP